MCPKLSRAAGKLGLAAASISLTLLVLEGLVQLAPQGRGKEERTIALYTEHDQLLGWRKRPGARATLHRRDYTVEVAINSRGLRDVERAYESPAFRILALGDSFVEGYSVPLEATLTRVLEVSLSRPDCPVEVLNGGRAAWSTDQELLFYRSDGARYGSKVVALFFYFNDVLFNDCDRYFGNPKPRLVVGSNGGLTLTGVPVPSWPAPVGADSPSEPEPEPQGGSALLSFTAKRLRIGSPGSTTGSPPSAYGSRSGQSRRTTSSWSTSANRRRRSVRHGARRRRSCASSPARCASKELGS